MPRCASCGKQIPGGNARGLCISCWCTWFNRRNDFWSAVLCAGLAAIILVGALALFGPQP